MNESCIEINKKETELETEEKIHHRFVIQFSQNLEQAKKGLTEKQIKNSEQFYLIMRRGKFPVQLPVITVYVAKVNLTWIIHCIRTCRTK